MFFIKNRRLFDLITCMCYDSARRCQMNDRLKKIRKTLQLSQRDFGGKMGITAPAISRLESGENAITERMILLVCKEYHVNEIWLRTGAGEMFAREDDDEISRLASEMHLDAFAIRALRAYQKLTPAHREVLEVAIAALVSEYIVEGEQEEYFRAQKKQTSQNDGLPPGAISQYTIEEHDRLIEEIAATILEKRHMKESS